MDKYKDNEIILVKMGVINLSKEVMRMAEGNPELLNAVYREISEKLGMNTAMIIYQMFKGQQISMMAQTSERWLSSTTIRKKLFDALLKKVLKTKPR